MAAHPQAPALDSGLRRKDELDRSRLVQTKNGGPGFAGASREAPVGLGWVGIIR